ncbi:syncytin-2-like [Eleutherodactylus coqui]|uniref:syncytin-2-like n=1 Tax=Eleutherodactylus coqui TaxID=57060 RepID=UPI003461FE97
MVHDDDDVGEDDVIQDNTFINIYEYCPYCKAVEHADWSNMTEFQVRNVSQAEVCYNFTCNPRYIGKCEKDQVVTSDSQILCSRTEEQCQKVVTTMSCEKVVRSPSHFRHVKLPVGWVVSCGNLTYTYIPANISGGPCALSRLSILMYQKPDPPIPTPRFRRDIHGLADSCVGPPTLLSFSEHTALAFSILGTPALAQHNARVINGLACDMVKGLNATSQALDLLLLDVQNIRRATLQNRATIDYLLMTMNHGCEEFEGMCCFNLSDNSASIHQQINRLRDLATSIKQGTDQGWFDWLTGSWFGLTLMKKILTVFVAVIIVLISVCCCIQYIPTLMTTWSTCFTMMSNNRPTVNANVVITDPEYDDVEPSYNPMTAIVLVYNTMQV